MAPDPARPFSVRVLGVRATALGTTFTVASDTQPHITVTVIDGKVSMDLLGGDGKMHHLAVLAAGQVQSIPTLAHWFAEAGTVLGKTGIPASEAAPIYDALMRAAAAAAAHQR